MRSLLLEVDVPKFINSLNPKQAKQVVGKIFELLSDVHPSNSEPLKAYKPCFRLRSGDYRVIYTYNQYEVRVLHVGCRNDDDVYESFDRKYRNLLSVK